MKNHHLFLLGWPLVALLIFNSQHQRSHAREASVPGGDTWDQIGAKAGMNYHGDGLAVTSESNGARLHCISQSLDAEAATNGLWVTSTMTNQSNGRFQVKAVRLGRPAVDWPLAETGTVTVDQQTVRFERAGLVEQYDVSMDGVRQDFIVAGKPAGFGELQVRLAAVGARVEATDYGAQLVPAHCGRRIAYSGLRVTDATGKKLSARIEVPPDDHQGQLAVLVDDDGAVYPVRIDPTFSDANWLALGLGLNNTVEALAVSSNTLYAGGYFTHSGGGPALNDIAQWNGSNWLPLGSGVEQDASNVNAGAVNALAISGNTLYVGGTFTNAGGVSATNIAQWNGSSWSALGSGIFNNSGFSGYVAALAVSSNTLYAGGWFLTAGGVSAKYIAQWNGSSWSALGTGMNNTVNALAVSGSTLYAGGSFTKASGVTARYVAQWNGSSWSALGSGMSNSVNALAVSGNTLYAGGSFTNAGGVPVNYIAQWNGSSWSALGSGMDGEVTALAVSGGILYAGGDFSMAGGVPANGIAQWDGSSWSALGSGVTVGSVNGWVYALAVSGNTLYASGGFSTAGTNDSANIAEALLPGAPVLPSITNVSISGSSLLLNGANGTSGQTCYVFSSTSLGIPFNLWTPVVTNVLSASGSFTIVVPNIVSPSIPQRYFVLQLP
jgi:hypothetical protein